KPKYHNIKWSLDKFIELSKNIHGDNFDYSKIRDDDIKTGYSNVTIVCKSCNYEFKRRILSHVKGKKCIKCVGLLPWTYDRFVSESIKTHKNKYDYSLINWNENIKHNTKLTIICNTCNNV